MSNAVVMATDHGKAILLISGGIFREVKDRQYYVGQRLEWDEEKRVHTAHVLRRGLLIAACLVLLLSSSTFAVTKYVPWTVVSVALGETSIQYRVNVRNEVLSVATDTEEGLAILDTVSAEPYEPLQAAMERTLSAIQTETEAETPVLVEIAPRFGDGKQAEEAVEKAGEKTEIPVTVEKAPWHEAGKPKEPPPRDIGPANEPGQNMQIPAEPAQTGNQPSLDAESVNQNMQAPADPGQMGNHPAADAEPAEQNMQIPADPEQTLNHSGLDAQSSPGAPEGAKQSLQAPGMEPTQQEMNEENAPIPPFGVADDLRENQEPPQETAYEMMQAPMLEPNQNASGGAFQQSGLAAPPTLDATAEQVNDNFVPDIQQQEFGNENGLPLPLDAVPSGHEDSQQQLSLPQNGVQDKHQGSPNSMIDQSDTSSVTEKADELSLGSYQGEHEQKYGETQLFNAGNIPYGEPVQQSLVPKVPNETMTQQAQDGTCYQNTVSSVTSNTPESIQGNVAPALEHGSQFPAEQESLNAETRFREQNHDRVEDRNDGTESQNVSPERPRQR